MINVNNVLVTNDFKSVNIGNLKVGQQIVVLNSFEAEYNNYSNIENKFLLRKYFDCIYCFHCCNNTSTIYESEDKIDEIYFNSNNKYEFFVSIDGISIEVKTEDCLDNVVYTSFDEDDEDDVDNEKTYKNEIATMLLHDPHCYVNKEIYKKYGREQISYTLTLRLSTDTFLIVKLNNSISKNEWNTYVSSDIYNMTENQVIETNIALKDLKQLVNCKTFSDNEYFNEFVNKIVKMYYFNTRQYIKNPEYLEYVISELGHEEELRNIFKCIYKDEKFEFMAYRKNVNHSYAPEIVYTYPEDKYKYSDIKNCIRKAEAINNFRCNNNLINPYNGDVILNSYDKVYEDKDSIVLINDKSIYNKRKCFIKIDDLFVETSGSAEFNYVIDKLLVVNLLTN